MKTAALPLNSPSDTSPPTNRAPVPERIEVAKTVLRIPGDVIVKRLSDPNTKKIVHECIVDSPDHTVYHFKPYLDLGGHSGTPPDLLGFFTKGSDFLFAAPFHNNGPNSFTTGYSGLLFPPVSTERNLKKSLKALEDLLRLNSNIEFNVIQSVQAPAYNDPLRSALIDRAFCSFGSHSAIFSRFLNLSPQPTSVPTLFNKPNQELIEFDNLTFLENDLLALYDPNCRNHIRQAIKSTLRLQVYFNSGRNEAVWKRLLLVHHDSSTRTSFTSHSLDYLMGLSQSVTDARGTDLLVITKDPSGNDIACVNSHLYNNRALYWYGCSNSLGLKHRANQFSLHAAITLNRALGCNFFEIGRFFAPELDEKTRSIDQYKAQFGGNILRVANFKQTDLTRSQLKNRIRRRLARLFR